MDELDQQFLAGISDYWRGWLPEKWNDAAHRARCAYCSGWYLASLADSNEEEEVCPDA